MEVIEEEISSCLGNRKLFPPGFRFHPSDEELVVYYLKRKICGRRLRMDVITEIDVYKWDPEELPGLSKLKTGERQWFFFSPRVTKYPNGGRSNRATSHGYWKATGKHRIIRSESRDVGVRKTLVFYEGRAPTAKRTDWVMHEFTLNEDEVTACESAKDYYALYKVFKKSGRGSKNGEQYGAPFREVDYADEESENNGPVDQEPIDESAAVVENRVRCQLQPLEDLEELVNGIADESLHIPLPLSVDDYDYALEEFVYEEEAQGNLVDQPSREVNILGQSIDLHPASQQIVRASFDLTQSGTSQLQLHEASEVTSAPKSHAVEDFLEMDDLNGPQPMAQSSEKSMASLENLQFDGLSELELDFNQDVALWLNVCASFDLTQSGTSQLQLHEASEVTSAPKSHAVEDFLEMNDLNGPQPMAQSSEKSMASLENLQFSDLNQDMPLWFNGFETGQQRQISQPYTNNIENESNIFCNNTEQEPINYESNVQDVSFQPWSHDQGSSIYTATESHQGTIPPSISGVVYDGNFSNHGSGADQNQSGRQSDGTDSLISYALWGFVEFLYQPLLLLLLLLLRLQRLL